jgi:hypothetical protein
MRDIREIVSAVKRRDAGEAERRVRERVMTSARNVLQSFEKATARPAAASHRPAAAARRTATSASGTAAPALEAPSTGDGK